MYFEEGVRWTMEEFVEEFRSFWNDHDQRELITYLKVCDWTRCIFVDFDWRDESISIFDKPPFLYPEEEREKKAKLTLEEAIRKIRSLLTHGDYLRTTAE